MRSPERRPGQRAGKNFENELSLKYLSPGAFTVLSPHEYGSAPDPPTAPQQYRLTPNTRRRKAQAFSIIAEASSNPGTRSPSPTGRVSPFRGRGFNPIGSRHASPNPSPPPPESRTSSSTPKINQSPKKSQIPQPTRRHSGVFTSGKLTNGSSPKFRRKNGSKLSPHLSKSLTNLSPKNVSSRPPPSPQGSHRKYSRKPAFEQLSPITASSPENGTNDNKSQSSSSKIPRSSKSQPTSRKSSPSRPQSSSSNHSSKQNSRPGSKNTSRNASPTKGQTKIPIKSSYKEISAKVNSFNKLTKPKVPQKPQNIKSASGERTVKGKLTRKPSIGKIQPGKHEEASTSSGHSSGNINTIRENTREDDGEYDDKVEKNGPENVIEEIVKEKEGGRKENVNKESNSGVHKSESSSKLSDLPTATTVVSSTTTTAVQPLKIDANIEEMLKEELNKVYSNDGATLSTPSVSSAMNKMNDTVLNSQTLLKDHGFSKLSPAASAIISLSNDSSKGNRALDTKSATTALPTIESIHKKLDDVGQNINSSFSDSNKVHMESIENTVKNNINKTLTPDHNNFGSSYVRKSANERLKEARTIVAADIKPIKILVKEKPSEVDVQSGNIRLPANATNGLNATPGLPPPQNQENEPHAEQEEEDETETQKMNCCRRLLARCRCKRCKRSRKSEAAEKPPTENTGCFGCRKKKQENKEEVSSGTNLTAEEAVDKPRFWDRLKCCKSKKIGDSSCCPGRKRTDSWVEKVNVPSTKSVSCKDKCKNALRWIFCCSCCCHKKKFEEDPESRRESMMSKKKSLTPTTVPPVDTIPKIDISLVEHNSLMRGAIPILPVSLAWFCLICNVFLPGVGTGLSGTFCLCLGKPRFSQNDGPRPRIGAFLIDLIIGCGQAFTVLFCLVGWGWSVWWGVIMLKIARKHERIRLVEERALGQVALVNENHHSRDPERAS